VLRALTIDIAEFCFAGIRRGTTAGGQAVRDAGNTAGDALGGDDYGRGVFGTTARGNIVCCSQSRWLVFIVASLGLARMPCLCEHCRAAVSVRPILHFTAQAFDKPRNRAWLFADSGYPPRCCPVDHNQNASSYSYSDRCPPTGPQAWDCRPIVMATAGPCSQAGHCQGQTLRGLCGAYCTAFTFMTTKCCAHAPRCGCSARLALAFLSSLPLATPVLLHFTRRAHTRPRVCDFLLLESECVEYGTARPFSCASWQHTLLSLENGRHRRASRERPWKPRSRAFEGSGRSGRRCWGSSWGGGSTTSRRRCAPWRAIPRRVGCAVLCGAAECSCFLFRPSIL